MVLLQSRQVRGAHADFMTRQMVSILTRLRDDSDKTGGLADAENFNVVGCIPDDFTNGDGTRFNASNTPNVVLVYIRRTSV